ncbi:hypothetical protein KR084_012979, partial [Drosophila pseudotakahashii]
MKVIVLICLLGCLANANGFLLHHLKDKMHPDGDDILGGIMNIFGLGDNSSHNKTAESTGSPLKLFGGIWDEFKKGVMSLLGSLNSGDGDGDDETTTTESEGKSAEDMSTTEAETSAEETTTEAETSAEETSTSSSTESEASEEETTTEDTSTSSSTE